MINYELPKSKTERLDNGVVITSLLYLQKESTQYFEVIERLFFCNDVNGLMPALNVIYINSEGSYENFFVT